MTVIQCLNKKEMVALVTGDADHDALVTERNPKGDKVFRGFTYFCPEEISDPGCNKPRYLVAFAKNSSDPSDITGVLKVHEFPNGQQSHYQGIMYIDVHRDHRRQGIATALFGELDNILDPGEIVIGSAPSQFAQSIDLNTTIEKIMKRCQYFSNAESYSIEKMVKKIKASK